MMFFFSDHLLYPWGILKCLPNDFLEFYSYEIVSSSDISEKEASHI